MALKPNGGDCVIKEQIIEDVVTGITLQFTRYDNGVCRLTLYGNFPFGNRDIYFDKTGAEAGGGTAVGGFCRPTWLKEVSAPVAED